MIQIKVTWPALILLLVALAVWLARDPGQRQPAPVYQSPSRPPRTARRPIIIEQPAPASDYAAETERLDREAADAARLVFEESTRQHQTIIEELNQRNDRRKARFNTRR